MKPPLTIHLRDRHRYIQYDGLGKSAEQARRFGLAVWKRRTDPNASYPYTIESFPTAKDYTNKKHKDYLGGTAFADVFAMSVTDGPYKRIALKIFNSWIVREVLLSFDIS